MDAESQVDNHGVNWEIPCWCSSTTELNHSIYYWSTEGLQPHLVTEKTDFFSKFVVSENSKFQAQWDPVVKERENPSHMIT